MERSKIVWKETDALYGASKTVMGKWMWRNHVQWVADKGRQLAEKYDADPEKVYCAALLHDLGDCKYERDHQDFEIWSWEAGKDILKKAGFRRAKRDEILEAIRTHSCHLGHLPTALEGRVVATADAMWHIQTSFFPRLCYMHRPLKAKTYDDWQAWFNEKIERDFTVKIFFEDEKEEVRANYEALVRAFGKQDLDSDL